MVDSAGIWAGDLNHPCIAFTTVPPCHVIRSNAASVEKLGIHQVMNKWN